MAKKPFTAMKKPQPSSWKSQYLDMVLKYEITWAKLLKAPELN
jgi:hypothetical protein